MLPVNCVLDRDHPHKIGEIGYDKSGKPVLTVLCRRHDTISSCSMMTLLQAWRELACGDEQALQTQLTRLRKAALDLETDLADLQRSKRVG
jgi:hypothetical protein